MDPLSAARLVWIYNSVRVQRINHISWRLVEEFLLPCPSVYYIFNAYYLCCLVTLRPPSAVFKNTFIALPLQSLLKKKQSWSSTWQRRAGCWLFQTHWPAHPSPSPELPYLLCKNSLMAELTLSCLKLSQNYSKVSLMREVHFCLQNYQCLHEQIHKPRSMSSGIKQHVLMTIQH